MKTKRLFSISFLGASIIVCAIYVLFASLGFTDPVMDALSAEPRTASFGVLYSVFPFYFPLDYAFIALWAFGWGAVLSLPEDRNPLFKRSLFFAGLIGPLLDFAETTLSVILLRVHRRGGEPAVGLLSSWILARDCSYFIPYIISLFFGIYVYGKKAINRTVAALSFAGSIAGVFGRIWSDAWFIEYAWWPLWFLSLGLYYRMKTEARRDGRRYAPDVPKVNLTASAPFPRDTDAPASPTAKSTSRGGQNTNRL